MAVYRVEHRYVGSRTWLVSLVKESGSYMSADWKEEELTCLKVKRFHGRWVVVPGAFHPAPPLALKHALTMESFEHEPAELLRRVVEAMNAVAGAISLTGSEAPLDKW